MSFSNNSYMHLHLNIRLRQKETYYLAYTRYGSFLRLLTTRYCASKQPKYCLHLSYDVHTLQVSPKLSCEDPWQTWTGFKVFNLYCAKSKFPATKKLTNGTLVTPRWFIYILVVAIAWHLPRKLTMYWGYLWLKTDACWLGVSGGTKHIASSYTLVVYITYMCVYQSY